MQYRKLVINRLTFYMRPLIFLWAVPFSYNFMGYPRFSPATCPLNQPPGKLPCSPAL